MYTAALLAIIFAFGALGFFLMGIWGVKDAIIHLA
jgi:hypothetical protein